MVEADASEGREYRMLGPLAALDGGVELALGAPKQRALLAVLLLQGGRVVPRARLIDTLWGDNPPVSAVGSLQLYVHGLRRVLGAASIETHGTSYRLALDDGQLDLDRFRALVTAARRALEDGDSAAAARDASAALALWRGPALSDLEGEPVMLEAGALDELRLAAVELRGDAELATGRHAELLADLEAEIEQHPYRERLREQQLLALYRSGRQKDAIERYHEVRLLLRDQLGMEPGRRLRDLERAMLQQDPALDAPAVRAPASALPAPLTPLVGRTAELADVTGLLREGARLVTLTGPGGTGKTRLALAAAAQIEGAVFVDLSALTDPQLVGSALADAIGLEGGDAEAQLAALRDLGPTLVVFDNFEHLLDGAPVVTRLLQRVPRLSVLATSRTPLRLGGEHVYTVPPLAVPAADAGADPETVMRSDAVQLFAQRARAAAQITIDGATAAPVAELCRRLDGLPLAIELAAVRCRTIALDDMVGRIGQALDLLAEGPRDAPARHQTLRATIDWSYRLLDEPQRSAFAQIAVFAGGFDEQAAAAVVDPAADPARSLAGLVEAGLVQAAGARNSMLQTIREYAQERLRDAGGEDEALARHRAHYLALAQRAADEIGAGHGDTATFAWYELEHDNLRAALASAAEQDDVATLVALATAMRQFWVVRGHLGEGRRAFDQAIAASRTATPELRATALRVGGALSWRQGDAAEARERWTEALALYQELGDDEHIGACVAELGTVAWSEGDLDRAATLYGESTASFRRAGNRTRLAIALSNLSDIERGRADLAAAAANAEQAAAIQRELGDVDGLAVTLHNQARVLLAAGDLDGCRPLLAESIDQALSIGYREVLAYCLECAAELALADGDAASGMRQLGASDHQFEQAETPIAGDEAVSRDVTAERLRAELGDAAADKLHRAGAAADLEELLAETRRVTLGG